MRKSQLSITEDLRRTIKAGLKNEIRLSPNLFNHMQQEIVRIINETTYPNFLQSDLYIQHIEDAQNAAIVTASTTNSSGSCSGNIPRSSTLPTLHEDTELSINDDMLRGNQTPADMPMRLTHDLLMATQKRRLEIRPQG